LDGLLALESAIPRAFTRTTVQKPPRKGVARTAEDRRQLQISEHLRRMENSIRTTKLLASGELPEGYDTNTGAVVPSWRNAKPRTVRPPTPSVPPSDQDAEGGEDEAITTTTAATLLLQRLLRGRAVQNTMFAGKEKRRELIDELRSIEEAVTAEAQSEHDRQDAAQSHQARLGRVQSAAIHTVQGETSSAMLDLLSKELIRHEQKLRLQALAERGDQTRRRRESAESGRRQAEEELRLREDNLYRQVMRAHQGSAASFVESLVGEAVEAQASLQAVAEVKNQPGVAPPLIEADAVASRASSAADKDAATEPVVRSLVASFLLPEVERHRVMDAVHTEEKRFVDAAHKTISQGVKSISEHATI
jgi:hypothetical protein